MSGADERLVADSAGSAKMCFREEPYEISHIFRDNSAAVPLYEEFQYYIDFPERWRNKSVMSSSELSLNVGIFHGEFYYCKFKNFCKMRNVNRLDWRWQRMIK